MAWNNFKFPSCEIFATFWPTVAIMLVFWHQPEFAMIGIVREYFLNSSGISFKSIYKLCGCCTAFFDIVNCWMLLCICAFVMCACTVLVEIVTTKHSSQRSTLLRVHTSLSWWNTPCRLWAVGTCVWPLLCLRVKTSMNGLLSTVSVIYPWLFLQWFLNITTYCMSGCCNV